MVLEGIITTIKIEIIDVSIHLQQCTYMIRQLWRITINPISVGHKQWISTNHHHGLVNTFNSKTIFDKMMKCSTE